MFQKNRKLIQLFFLIIVFSFFLFSCTYNNNFIKLTKNSELSNTDLVNHFKNHEESSDFENWRVKGYFHDKSDNLFHYSITFTKGSFEGRKIWMVTSSVYDYTNSKKYYSEEYSLAPLLNPAKYTNSSITIGSCTIKWSKKRIYAKFSKEDFTVTVKLNIPKEKAFYLLANNDKNNIIASRNLGGKATINVNGVNSSSETNYGFFIKDSMLTLEDKVEIFCINTDNTEYVSVSIPRNNQYYNFVYDKESKETIIDQRLKYTYDTVATDRNRKYAINWGFSFTNKSLYGVPFLENNTYSTFIGDYWESLIFVFDKKDNLIGMGVVELQEHCRRTYYLDE